MTIYVDSSALLKAFVDEPDSAVAAALITSDQSVATSWITVVEVRRNLTRIVTADQRSEVNTAVEGYLDGCALVVAGEIVCRAAARIGQELGVRSLDALHLASAQALQVPGLSFVTFDLRQAQGARSLGLTVLGC